MEDTDDGFVGAALRETEEELGISEGRIEILGEVGPAEVNRGGTLSVWPFAVKTTSNASGREINGIGANRDSSTKAKNGTTERMTILSRLWTWRSFGRPFPQRKLLVYSISHWK